MLKKYNKKTLLICFTSLGLFLALCITMGVYFRDTRGGFVVDGNRVVINLEIEDGNVLITLNKAIVSSAAFQGIVYIAISPQISDKWEPEPGEEIPVWTYEVLFTDARRESFTIEFPLYHDDPKMRHIVLLNVGTELVRRPIWKI